MNENIEFIGNDMEAMDMEENDVFTFDLEKSKDVDLMNIFAPLIEH